MLQSVNIFKILKNGHFQFTKKFFDIVFLIYEAKSTPEQIKYIFNLLTIFRK